MDTIWFGNIYEYRSAYFHDVMYSNNQPTHTTRHRRHRLSRHQTHRLSVYFCLARVSRVVSERVQKVQQDTNIGSRVHHRSASPSGSAPPPPTPPRHTGKSEGRSLEWERALYTCTTTTAYVRMECVPAACPCGAEDHVRVKCAHARSLGPWSRPHWCRG